MRQLPKNEIHVWTGLVSEFTPFLCTFSDMLSEEEQKRVEGFAFDHLKDNYIISHAILRLLIGQYQDQPPQLVTYHFGASGKPYIEGLYFSMSHSHEALAYAFSRSCELGIDIEKISPNEEMDQMASMILTENEQSLYRSLQLPERTAWFYQTWAIKEAILKALGEGLSMPMNLIALDQEHWSIHNFQRLPGYAGALAYKNHDYAIHFFNLKKI